MSKPGAITPKNKYYCQNCELSIHVTLIIFRNVIAISQKTFRERKKD